jgi:hypothetical protein
MEIEIEMVRIIEIVKISIVVMLVISKIVDI